MRKRKEIEKQHDTLTLQKNITSGYKISIKASLILEVLLDIRAQNERVIKRLEAIDQINIQPKKFHEFKSQVEELKNITTTANSRVIDTETNQATFKSHV
jgi:hypothetical protein